MPLTAIVIHVTRRGPRADELLAGLSARLGRDVPAPDERGHVRILFEEGGSAAWHHVQEALDAAGDDWRECLHVNAEPHR